MQGNAATSGQTIIGGTPQEVAAALPRGTAPEELRLLLRGPWAGALVLLDANSAGAPPGATGDHMEPHEEPATPPAQDAAPVAAPGTTNPAEALGPGLMALPQVTPGGCPACRGMRFVAFDVPVGHPRFGKTAPCPACNREDGGAYLEQLCGLTAEMRAWTFANTLRLPGIAPALDAARTAATRPRWFFTLLGPCGLGKTRLLACMVNAGRAAGRPSVYLTTAELLQELRSGFSPEAPLPADERWRRLLDARILALDELDRFSATPWAQERLFMLVEWRYRHGEELLTAFAANAELEALPAYLASRMEDKRCRLFQLTGNDIRAMPRRPARGQS